MNFLDNIRVGTKLTGSFLLIVGILLVVGIIGVYSVLTLSSYLDQINENQLIPTQKLGIINADIWRLRGNTAGYVALPTNRENLRKQSEALIASMNANITDYQKYAETDEEKIIYARFVDSWHRYLAAIDTFNRVIDSGNAEEIVTTMTTGDLITSRAEASTAIQDLVAYKIQYANSLAENTKKTVLVILVVIVSAIIIGAIIAISLGFLISRSITIPLAKAVLMMREMSLGHLGNRLNYTRNDEIGELTSVMDTFSDDLQYSVVASVKQISQGDLSVTITPKDEQDEISLTLIQLISSLQNIIQEISYLITEAEEGRLQNRGNETLFVGAYQHIIVGINNMLDAITTPLNEALRVADLFSHAKFSARFDENVMTNGDLIALKQGLNTIGSELSLAITNVSEQVATLTASSEQAAASVEEITAGSASIAQSSNIVSANADNSVQAVEQVLVAMQELNSSVTTVATKVDMVNRLSLEANAISSDGVKKAVVAEDGINAINTSVHDVGVIISEINDQMKEIGKIVEIIGGIADQTNLLALNAAIEAARAGDAGRGFAVVAEEVKTLAQESQGSTDNIAKIINSLQSQALRAGEAMNQATNEVSRGSTAITETIQYFNSIANQVEEISTHMTEIASLSEEEAAAVEEITSNVSEVKTMAVETAKEAISSASASEESSAALNQVSTIISDLSVIATRIEESMSRLNG
ncbi:HAMP domain-containing methyl-accepting chemotaxis protein [Methanospirillum lacunae]|uniref:HAMP domain-containing methyl-accepting chemotaxis protein n=1 Tax=Methanospirillum lacunae TaxID=668570 RepID=UPI0015E85A37|nr:methyl-accepting chemotaxis protein [Methanospirillum lacunae]